jgi:hypothetical protein
MTRDFYRDCIKLGIPVTQNIEARPSSSCLFAAAVRGMAVTLLTSTSLTYLCILLLLLLLLLTPTRWPSSWWMTVRLVNGCCKACLLMSSACKTASWSHGHPGAQLCPTVRCR